MSFSSLKCNSNNKIQINLNIILKEWCARNLKKTSRWTNLPKRSSKRYKNQWKNPNFWGCSTSTWLRSPIPKTKTNMIPISNKWKKKASSPNTWNWWSWNLSSVLELISSPTKIKNIRWSSLLICVRPTTWRNLAVSQVQMAMVRQDITGKCLTRWVRSGTIKMCVNFV